MNRLKIGAGNADRGNMSNETNSVESILTSSDRSAEAFVRLIEACGRREPFIDLAFEATTDPGQCVTATSGLATMGDTPQCRAVDPRGIVHATFAAVASVLEQEDADREYRSKAAELDARDE